MKHYIGVGIGTGVLEIQYCSFWCMYNMCMRINIYIFVTCEAHKLLKVCDVSYVGCMCTVYVSADVSVCGVGNIDM